MVSCSTCYVSQLLQESICFYKKPKVFQSIARIFEACASSWSLWQQAFMSRSSANPKNSSPENERMSPWKSMVERWIPYWNSFSGGVPSTNHCVNHLSWTWGGCHVCDRRSQAGGVYWCHRPKLKEQPLCPRRLQSCFFCCRIQGVFLVEVSSKITSYQQMKWPLILSLRSSHPIIFES